MSPAPQPSTKLTRQLRQHVPDELRHLLDGKLGDALAKAIGYAQHTVSPTTEAIYADDFDAFRAWCLDHAVPYLPAPPAVVAAYLADRAETMSGSSLRVVLAALAYHHRRAGHVWTAADPVIASVLRGIRRHQRRPVRPAAALGSDELRRMVGTCDDSLAGVRDRALLLLGFAGGLRRSELVAIDVEHLQFRRDGLKLGIASSKTDQDGQGAAIGIARGEWPDTCPVRSLQAWLRLARIEYGPVFRRVTAAGTLEGRLTGNGVWRRIRARAEQAGVQAPEGERLSPHGLRAGFICEAYLNGALDEQVMAHARQTNVATTRRYRARAKVVQASPTKLLDL